MKNVADLTREELESLVNSIRNALYFDSDAGVYDPDKEWNQGTTEMVASELECYGLLPQTLGDVVAEAKKVDKVASLDLSRPILVKANKHPALLVQSCLPGEKPYLVSWIDETLGYTQAGTFSLAELEEQFCNEAIPESTQIYGVHVRDVSDWAGVALMNCREEREAYEPSPAGIPSSGLVRLTLQGKEVTGIEFVPRFIHVAITGSGG